MKNDKVIRVETHVTTAEWYRQYLITFPRSCDTRVMTGFPVVIELQNPNPIPPDPPKAKKPPSYTIEFTEEWRYQRTRLARDVWIIKRHDAV